MIIFSEDLLNRLTKLGFTNYEAKAYLSLLKNNPATGYEISNQAHVPRSVIYATLRKLEARGIVISIHEKPRRYIPLSPKQLLAKLESNFSERLSSLSEELLAYENKPDTEGFWNLRGYKSLIQISETHIREAKDLVCIHGWRREIMALKSPLMAARERGVDIIIFSFNKIDEDFGKVFAYGIDEKKLAEIWNHKFILVADAKELVMGPANKKADEQAIWTQNNAVLNIATNYIILDITLFGQRMEIDVSDTVTRLMTEKVDHLDELIQATTSDTPDS